MLQQFRVIYNFEGPDPVFVQKHNWSSVRADKSIKNDRKELMLRFDASQLVLIRVPIAH